MPALCLAFRAFADCFGLPKGWNLAALDAGGRSANRGYKAQAPGARPGGRRVRALTREGWRRRLRGAGRTGNGRKSGTGRGKARKTRGLARGCEPAAPARLPRPPPPPRRAAAAPCSHGRGPSLSQFPPACAYTRLCARVHERTDTTYTPCAGLVWEIVAGFVSGACQAATRSGTCAASTRRGVRRRYANRRRLFTNGLRRRRSSTTA